MYLLLLGENAVTYLPISFMIAGTYGDDRTGLHQVFSQFRSKNFYLYCLLWQYGLQSFQTGDTKLERFLPKNQHTKRKLLNFEFWINSKLSKKIGHHFSDKIFYILVLSKNVNNKKCAPKLVFFDEKKTEKDFDDF